MWPPSPRCDIFGSLNGFGAATTPDADLGAVDVPSDNILAGLFATQMNESYINYYKKAARRLTGMIQSYSIAFSDSNQCTL